MPTIFVLNIEEFDPIVLTARKAGMQIRCRGRYTEASSTKLIVTLERRHTNVRPAIWFAALTGGLIGQIDELNHDILRISEQTN